MYLFVSHLIFRGPYTIHSAKAFPLLPSQSLTLHVISNIQKNWGESFYTQKEVMDNNVELRTKEEKELLTDPYKCTPEASDCEAMM